MKRYLQFLTLLISSICLSACGPDLGAFEKEDNYESFYKAFGDVTGLYDGGKHSYDIADSLFNTHTVETFTTEDSGDEVEKEQYLYLILEIEEFIDIEAIVLFFDSTVTGTLQFNCFYYENSSLTPNHNKLKYLSSPDTKHVTDEIIGGSGVDTINVFLENETIEPGTVSINADEKILVDDGEGHITGTGLTSGTIDYVTGAISLTFVSALTNDAKVSYDYIVKYEDPDDSESNLSGSLPLVKDEWDSTVFGGFNQYGYDDGLLHAREDSYLYIRIENNSGHKKDTLQPMTIKFINLMVRAI